MIWPRNRDGKYSVKTGYQLLLELDRRSRASSFDANPPKIFWNWLWRIGIPNKVSLFMASVFRGFTDKEKSAEEKGAKRPNM